MYVALVGVVTQRIGIPHPQASALDGESKIESEGLSSQGIVKRYQVRGDCHDSVCIEFSVLPTFLIIYFIFTVI